MATIKLVTRRDEAQGLSLARELADHHRAVSAVVWWAGQEDAEPRMLVGFTQYRENGPRVAVNQLSDALVAAAEDAPDFFVVDAVPSDDPRLLALAWQPWTTVPLNVPDLAYRYVNVWSHSVGAGQVLVYFLRVGEEIRVPLPPTIPQAA